MSRGQFLLGELICEAFGIVSLNKFEENALQVNEDIVADFINALPGNSSVNTVQHTTIDEILFSMSVPRPTLLTDQ
jgi:hypothetical protein